MSTQPLLQKYDRVNRSNPCPICGKKDYCLVSKDRVTAICPRTMSDKPYGDAGFVHVIDSSSFKANEKANYSPMPTPTITDWTDVLKGFDSSISRDQIRSLAESLGVSEASLCVQRIGYSYRYDAFTFPMYDSSFTVVGVRLRNEKGQKWAVHGSRNGMFIPWINRETFDSHEDWNIVEGPTDLAAAITLGLWAIGRPSSSACVDWTCELMKGKRVTIVSNYDETKYRKDGSRYWPGQDGSAKLADALCGTAKAVRIMYPAKGHKDLRAWLGAGASPDSFDCVRKNTAPWRRRIA